MQEIKVEISDIKTGFFSLLFLHSEKYTAEM